MPAAGRPREEAVFVGTVWNSSPVRFIREMVDLYFSKNVSRSAAELAYFLILTFFPVLICVNGFVGLLKLDPVTLLSGIEEFLPRGTLDVVAEYVGYISTNQSTAMLVAGLSATLFSASAAFRALMNIMSDIYERKTYTGIFQIIASVLFSSCSWSPSTCPWVVVLTGGWLFTLVEDFFHLNPGDLPWDWQWIRFPILFCLVLLFVLLVYRISAPRGKPRPPILTGGILASVALVAASILFSWFIGLSSRYSWCTGPLTSVVILLLWLYLCGNI